MPYRIEVRIMPRRGILDPQGKAVGDALHALGFADVGDVRVGRHITLDLDGNDQAAAERAAREMCDRLLANPVTEEYTVTVGRATTAEAAAR